MDGSEYIKQLLILYVSWVAAACVTKSTEH